MWNVAEYFTLTGKKAIVTGGAGGLGKAMAQALYDAGAEVVLIGRNEKRLIETAEEMESQEERVHYTIGDLNDLGNLELIYNRALEKLDGRLDILVNSAGIQYRCRAEDFPTDHWLSVINVNLNAVFVFSRLAGKTMLEQRKGKIINIASMTSFFGSEMIPAYAASKGGIMQLTKALSNEWAGRGVNVNAIAPGYMETELVSDMKEKNPHQYMEITSRIPAHRWGKPEDLKGIVVFLSGNASDYISGAIIPVDGGYLGK